MHRDTSKAARDTQEESEPELRLPQIRSRTAISLRTETHTPEIVARFGLLEDKRFITCLDLELTCWGPSNPAQNPPLAQEIIEVGFVVVKADDPTSMEKSVALIIKPTTNPVLSDYCKALTGITQEEVDKAPTLPEAWSTLAELLPPETDYIWANWGTDSAALQEEIAIKTGETQLSFDPRYLNVAHCARTAFGKKLGGLNKALEKFGIAQEQPAHRALPDAISLQRVLCHLELTPTDAMVSGGKTYRERLERIKAQLVQKISSRHRIEPDFAEQLLELVNWDGNRARNIISLFHSQK